MLKERWGTSAQVLQEAVSTIELGMQEHYMEMTGRDRGGSIRQEEPCSLDTGLTLKERAEEGDGEQRALLSSAALSFG